MKFSDLSCREFILQLASKQPVPGGGGASALVAGVGVALGNMVGSLTLGKKKYADVQDDITSLKQSADTLQTELLELMEKDAQVFEPLSRAYGMPSETDEQKAEKSRVMEAALSECAKVPLEVMEKCCAAVDLHEQFAAKGTTIAISDVGCGVICCKAALQAASLNVFINTRTMQNREKAGEYNVRAQAMLGEYTAKADRIFEDVATRLK